MPNKIIKDSLIVEDQWQLIDSEATEIPEGMVIIPFALWNAHKESLGERDKLGIWLNSDESPQLIADHLDRFAVVAINFPAFADGRGFSYGRQLRDQYNYQGEVRAIGEFISDQLYYLRRCGFNTYALQGIELEDAIEQLTVFSDSYQAAIDQPAPLFKRR